MPDYRSMYLSLFNAITDAIDQLDQHNYGTARAMLVQAQVDGEEQYISDPNETE